MLYIRALLPILVAVITYCLAVVYTTKQSLDYLEEAPLCFPPYFLMKGDFGVGNNTHTGTHQGPDEGLRPPGRLTSAENIDSPRGDPP